MSITKLQKLIERTAEEFGVCPRAIISRDGTRPVTAARAVVAFLLKDDFSTAQISSLLGRKSPNYKRASVIKVFANAKSDHKYNQRVLRLSDEFGVSWD